jgi:hypothetical protein
MNKKETATYQSNRVTHNYCTEKSSDFDDVPGFNELIPELGKELDIIWDQNVILEESVKGYTKERNASKETLLDLFLPILGKIKILARYSKDKLLLERVNYTPSKLKRTNGVALKTAITVVTKLCQENMAGLKQYGLTDAMLTELGAAVADFNEKLEGTPKYKAVLKATRETMDASFARVAEIFRDSLDVLVELIRDTNKQTYLEYKNTRKVVVYTRRLSLKGKVLDADTRQPIAEVKISITQLEDPEMPKKANGGGALDKGVKISAAKGGFQLKTMEAGVYTLTTSKKGYRTQTITIYVNDNERTNVLLELTRV